MFGKRITGILLLMLLSGCVVGSGVRPGGSGVSAPAGGDALVFIEQSTTPLSGYGTMTLQVDAEPSINPGALEKFRALLSVELARQLKKQTQLTLVGQDSYSDLTLQLQVVELAYVDFFARISGLAGFRRAVLATEIVLLDNYTGKTLWRIRTRAQSRWFEGPVAASTTTQVIGLSETLARAFRDHMD